MAMSKFKVGEVIGQMSPTKPNRTIAKVTQVGDTFEYECADGSIIHHVNILESEWRSEMNESGIEVKTARRINSTNIKMKRK